VPFPFGPRRDGGPFRYTRENAVAKENKMKKMLLTLLLLSLALTGCIVEPFGGNGHRGDAGRGEFHPDRDHNGGWNR
jgi:hypothetical protein